MMEWAGQPEQDGWAMCLGRRAMEVTALAAILLTAAGCGKSGQAPAAATPPPAMKPAPPTPIDTKRAEIGGPMWDPEWDKIVELALPPELLSAQAGRDRSEEHTSELQSLR